MQPRKPEDVPDYKVTMWNKVWDRLPKDGQAECFGKCGLARVSKRTPLRFWWAGEPNLFWQKYDTLCLVAGKLIFVCTGRECNYQPYVHQNSKPQAHRCLLPGMYECLSFYGC